MSGRGVGRFVLLSLAFAAASWVGWGTVPAVALLWGVLRPAVRRPAAMAAFAAATGWAAWLGVDAVLGRGALGRLGGRLSGILAVPEPVLYLTTLLLVLLLAWSAAVLGGLIPRRAD